MAVRRPTGLLFLIFGLFLLVPGCSDEDTPQFLVQTETTPTQECAGDGTQFSFGYDTTGDGVIDDLQSQEMVCNNDRFLSESAEAGTDECLYGGTVHTFGYDTTGDGVIDNVSVRHAECAFGAALETELSGLTVLYYNDRLGVIPDDDLLDGLQQLETLAQIELTQTKDLDEVTTLMQNEDYDIVFYFAQDISPRDEHKTLLENRILSQKKTVAMTFRTEDSNFANIFEASFSEETNETDILLLGSLQARLPETQTLENPAAYITWTTGLTPTGDASSLCEFNSGDSCAVLGNDGNSLMLGFVDGSFDPEHSVDLTLNILRTLLN